jgi:hypothetical protein
LRDDRSRAVKWQRAPRHVGRWGGVTEVRRDPRGVELMRLCRVQHRFGLYLLALDDQLDGGQPAPRSSPG